VARKRLQRRISKDTIQVVYQIHQTEQYARWFDGLRDRQARARILVRIRRLSLGGMGDAKRLGGGVLELKVDYGPGYRIYVARRGQGAGAGPSAGGHMSGVSTRTWDAADHLRSREDMAAYLEAALEDGSAVVVAAALGDIARASGMSAVARESGLGRESLYKALSPGGNPELATVLKVVHALGLRLHAGAADSS